jgi:hypothetical protein
MKKIIPTVAASLLPLMASATNNIPVSNNLKSKNGLSVFITSIAVWFEGIIFAISILFILYAAFLFITAAGNEEKIGKAKSIIVFGMIGIAVALLAFAVQSFVTSVLQ